MQPNTTKSTKSAAKDAVLPEDYRMGIRRRGKELFLMKCHFCRNLQVAMPCVCALHQPQVNCSNRCSRYEEVEYDIQRIHELFTVLPNQYGYLQWTNYCVRQAGGFFHEV